MKITEVQLGHVQVGKREFRALHRPPPHQKKPSPLINDLNILADEVFQGEERTCGNAVIDDRIKVEGRTETVPVSGSVVAAQIPS